MISQLPDDTKLGKRANSSTDYTVGDVKTQQDEMNKAYLYAYANSLNNNFGVETFIPDYARTKSN